MTVKMSLDSASGGRLSRKQQATVLVLPEITMSSAATQHPVATGSGLALLLRSSWWVPTSFSMDPAILGCFTLAFFWLWRIKLIRQIHQNYKNYRNIMCSLVQRKNKLALCDALLKRLQIWSNDPSTICISFLVQTSKILASSSEHLSRK